MPKEKASKLLTLQIDIVKSFEKGYNSALYHINRLDFEMIPIYAIIQVDAATGIAMIALRRYQDEDYFLECQRTASLYKEQRFLIL